MKQSGRWRLPLVLLGLLPLAGCAQQATPTGGGAGTRQFGESCNNDTEKCLAGLVCEVGVCRKVCNIKEDCRSDMECIGNRCVVMTADPVTVCGDGKREGKEECDDGNKNDGDCCSSNCDLEPHCYCNETDCGCVENYNNKNDGRGCTALDDILPVGTCGDGIQEGDETCDDGNKNDGDCCSSNCRLEQNCVCFNTNCRCIDGFASEAGFCQRIKTAAQRMLPEGAGVVTISGEITNGHYTITVVNGTISTNSKENQIIIDNGVWVNGENQ